MIALESRFGITNQSKDENSTESLGATEQEKCKWNQCNDFASFQNHLSLKLIEKHFQGFLLIQPVENCNQRWFKSLSTRNRERFVSTKVFLIKA